MRKIKMNLYLAIGILCLTYFIGVVCFTRTGTSFYLLWGVIAAGFLCIGVLRYLGLLERYVPLIIRRLAAGGFLLCMVLFIIVEGFIISGFFQKGEPGLSYIIVLGAQVRETGPSHVLKLRLDTAYDYLDQNEATKVVVSGGQGANEPESEAACMQAYLIEKGIAPERIIMEDKSTNTFENLTFSKALIDDGEQSVGIVSNNFHIFRAVKIAEKAGYDRVEGIAAPAYIALQPNNMLREFFGVMKDFVCGNM